MMYLKASQEIMDFRTKIMFPKFVPSSFMSQPHFGAKCENATHTPKSEKMESSGTPENSKDDLRGQISLHW